MWSKSDNKLQVSSLLMLSTMLCQLIITYGQNSTSTPSINPSGQSQTLSEYSTTIPSSIPTTVPSIAPTNFPSNNPTNSPTIIPSKLPSGLPSESPSGFPSVVPTNFPTQIPSIEPSILPSNSPTIVPSQFSTISPSNIPSMIPSMIPSILPSHPIYTPITTMNTTSIIQSQINSDDNNKNNDIYQLNWIWFIIIISIAFFVFIIVFIICIKMKCCCSQNSVVESKPKSDVVSTPKSDGTNLSFGSTFSNTKNTFNKNNQSFEAHFSDIMNNNINKHRQIQQNNKNKTDFVIPKLSDDIDSKEQNHKNKNDLVSPNYMHSNQTTISFRNEDDITNDDKNSNIIVVLINELPEVDIENIDHDKEHEMITDAMRNIPKQKHESNTTRNKSYSKHHNRYDSRSQSYGLSDLDGMET